jgi:hypothetical protein
LRELRQPARGGYIIDRRRRGPVKSGIWEYRLRKG